MSVWLQTSMKQNSEFWPLCRVGHPEHSLVVRDDHPEWSAYLNVWIMKIRQQVWWGRLCCVLWGLVCWPWCQATTLSSWWWGTNYSKTDPESADCRTQWWHRLVRHAV